MINKKIETIFIVSYYNDNFGDNLLKLYHLQKINNGNLIFLKNFKTKNKTINSKLSSGFKSKENIIFLNKKIKFTFIYNLLKSQKVYFIGGIFQDISSKKSFIYYYFILFASIILNKEIYMFNSTFEIKNIFLKKLFLNLMDFASRKNLIKIIEVRDYVSLNLIKNIEAFKKLIKDPFDKREKKNRRLKKYIILRKNFTKDNVNYFKTNFLENSTIFIFSINKSYFSKKGKGINQNFISEYFLFSLKKAGYDLLFIISDPKDFDFINKMLKNKKISIHLIKISQKSLNSLKKILQNYQFKILYAERLHSFLVLKNFVDLIIIKGNKVENYINTWYNNKILP